MFTRVKNISIFYISAACTLCRFLTRGGGGRRLSWLPEKTLPTVLSSIPHDHFNEEILSQASHPLHGKEKTKSSNIRSEGWILRPSGRSRDRFGQPMTVRSMAFEPYYERSWRRRAATNRRSVTTKKPRRGRRVLIPFTTRVPRSCRPPARSDARVAVYIFLRRPPAPSARPAP